MASRVQHTEVQQLPIQLFSEFTLFNDQEIAYIQKTLATAGIRIGLYQNEHGAYALFLCGEGDRAQIQAVDAGIFGQCIGLFFGDQEKTVNEIALSQARMELELQLSNSEYTLPPFNPKILIQVLQSIIWDGFHQASELDPLETEVLRRYLYTNNMLLSIYYDPKSHVPRGIFFEDANGTIRTLETESSGTVAGFVLPQKNSRQNTAWKRKLEEEFKPFSPNAAEFVLPVRAQMEPLIAELHEQLDPYHNGELHSLKRRETEHFDFRAEVEALLSKTLSPYGIQVLDAKELLQGASNEALISPHLVNPFPMFDFIFVRNNHAALDFTSVELLGWQTPSKKNAQPQALTPYGNVYGVVLIENETPLSDRKKIMRTAGQQLRRLMPPIPPGTAVQPTILTVDSNLLDVWQMDSPLATVEAVETVKKRSTTKKLRDYGFFVPSAEPPEVELHMFESGGKSHIGGTQLALVVRHDKQNANAIMLDRGWIFDLIPSWSELGRQPPYVDGIAPFLHNQMFDITPRLYQLPLILNSINSGVLNEIAQNYGRYKYKYAFNSIEEYLLLEAYHRLGEEQFQAMMAAKAPAFASQLFRRKKHKDFFAFLQKRTKTIYDRKTLFDMLAITHAHQDHAIGSSFVRDEVRRGWSPITRAILLSDHRISSQWFVQDTAARKMREMEKIGSAYPVFEYPYQPFIDGQKIEVSPGVFLTPIEVYHSIPGTMGFHIEVMHKGKKITSVSYPGDYRDARFFEEVGKLGGTDLLLVEGTNPPTARGKKSSAKYTEQDVAANFDRTIAEANDSGKAIVIDLVKNGYERLKKILDIAEMRGRTVAISPKIMQRLHYLQFAVHNLGQDLVHGEIPLIPPGDPRIAVWKPPKSRYSKSEDETFQTYGPVVTPEDVALNPERYIVIRENEQPEKMLGIGQGNVVWIDSTYGAYDESARHFKKYLKEFARKMDWHYVTIGYHASGHVPLYWPEEDPDRRGVLAQIPKAKPKEVLPLHTQKRGEVADVIQAYPEMKNIRVRSRVGHPRHKIALTR